MSNTKDINDAIRRQSKRSKTVKITGLNGQNYVAVGLNIEKQLSFEGSAGDFFGALNDGAILNIKGKVRRFLGDTMLKGGIILQGNAAHGVGCAMKGGIIVIRGDVSGDVGQSMSGGTIIISGNADAYSAAFMYNGEVIVGGNIGRETGDYMVGGAIFVGGEIGSLGTNTKLVEPTENDINKLKKYFQHYGITKDLKDFKKIIPIEGRSLINQFFDTNSYSRTKYEETNVNEIVNKTLTGLLQFTGALQNSYSNNTRSFFDAFTILPEQTQPTKVWPGLGFNVDTRLKIGGNLKTPLIIQSPFYLESRGTGIVSTSTKMAFAYAAAKHGTLYNTGGTTIQEEQDINSKYNGYLLHQWSPNRMGVNTGYFSSCSAIELALGNSSGGSVPYLIPANKITNDIIKLWKLPGVVDVIIPPKPSDFEVPADLKRHIELLREITEYKIPILIKISAGNVYNDTKLAIRAGADAIVIECIDNFTQNLPTVVAEHVGLSSIAAVPPAVRAIKETRVDTGEFKLFISGFFRNGADIFKVLALGANGVVLNTTAEVAIGCTLCGSCNQNICPAGIGTTDVKLETKLDWYQAGEKLTNFMNALAMELKLLTFLAGCKNISQINTEHIRALTSDGASSTGVKLAGFEKQLPLWEH